MAINVNCPSVSPVGQRAAPWLVTGGRMGAAIRSLDWNCTSLGPLEGWPQSLRTTLGLCLSSHFPIAVTWGPRNALLYNDGYLPIAGAKHPVCLGQDFRACWPSAWSAVGAAFERALQGEASYLENVRTFLERNGYPEEVFVTFSFSPIRDESGGVGGVFHPVTETTGRVLSERRARILRDLNASTSRAHSVPEVLQRAAQTLRDAEYDLPFSLLYMVDHERQRAHLIAQTGLAPGTSCAPLDVDLTLRDAEAPWPLAQVYRLGEACALEDLTERLSGVTVGPYPEPLRRALVLVLSQPGLDQPAGFLVAGVSARLPLDEAYASFFNLLATGISAGFASAQAYEQERARADVLAEIDRAKTAFFSNISHEFRTPLTLILGLLEEELGDPERMPRPRRERITVARRNARSLLRMVNTLLDFSRVEAGRNDAIYRPTDLAALTCDLASVFRSTVEGARLTLECDCPQLTQTIYVDPDMWEKIVLNLLSNAFKHTFSGSIRVALSEQAGAVALHVEDTGVGIAAHELPRIFERFHRVRGAKARSHEGTGIGLALVKELVGLHGGSVEVQSIEDRGTCFTVRIPTGTGHLPAERVTESRAESRGSARSALFVDEALHRRSDEPEGRDSDPSQVPSSVSGAVTQVPRARILLADDNADMREYVARLLRGYHDVSFAADGQEALALALESPPDLVLCDVMMPVLDGLALLRALRVDARTQTVPVILLSALASEESAVSGLDAGADDYLAKPFSARELLARVGTHLQLSNLRRENAAALERANQELEAFSYSVSHDLRAPLRAIIGFNEALIEDCAAALDDEGKSYLGRVQSAAARMMALIDALLDLARLKAGPVERTQVELSALARRVLDELQARHPERHVQRVIRQGLVTRGDAGLVGVILDNLLGNAWKFTAERDDACLEFGQIEGASPATYFVRDNGAGFDTNFAERLFQPFQRMHTHERFPGTGIGLATVQRAVSRHGGRVWADAAPGKGATFYFTLSERG